MAVYMIAGRPRKPKWETTKLEKDKGSTFFIEEADAFTEEKKIVTELFVFSLEQMNPYVKRRKGKRYILYIDKYKHQCVKRMKQFIENFKKIS